MTILSYLSICPFQIPVVLDNLDNMDSLDISENFVNCRRI